MTMRQHRPTRREIGFYKSTRRKHFDKAESERQEANEHRAVILRIIGKRDGFYCAKCGAIDNLTLDHIVPLVLGGRTELGNLQILCEVCNKVKDTQIIDYRGTRA